MPRHRGNHAHWRVRLAADEWITVCDRDYALALYGVTGEGVRVLLYDHPGAWPCPLRLLRSALGALDEDQNNRAS
jgi:hypothetical protein